MYCSNTGCCSSTCCCCCGRCSSTRRWWSTGSHSTESLVEQNCVSSGYWLCVFHGPKAAVSQYTDGGKKTTKKTTKSRQRMHMHLLVRDNTWAGPSNTRAGPRNCRAGPYRARVSWASLPCDGPGRAGPGFFGNVMGWPGRGPFCDDLMDQAGPRPIL